MATKHKDGKVIPLNSEDPNEYFIRGHVSHTDICAALVRYLGDNDPFEVNSVRQGYAFFGVGLDEMGDPSSIFYERDKPGRGRFKVTRVRVSKPDPILKGF